MGESAVTNQEVSPEPDLPGRSADKRGSARRPRAGLTLLILSGLLTYIYRSNYTGSPLFRVTSPSLESCLGVCCLPVVLSAGLCPSMSACSESSGSSSRFSP